MLSWLLGSKDPSENLSTCTKHKFDRQDPYLFYASDILPANPITVEVGSFTGKHARALYQAHHGNVIVYEAAAKSFAKLKDAVADLPITVVNKAVTGQRGETTFHDYPERPSSSSVFDRKLKNGVPYQVKTVGLEHILEDHNLPRIDVLFSNAEGAELGMLEEVLAKPELWERIHQLCISFHPQIYGKGPRAKLLQKFADRKAELYFDDKAKYPCHLIVNPKRTLA